MNGHLVGRLGMLALEDGPGVENNQRDARQHGPSSSSLSGRNTAIPNHSPAPPRPAKNMVYVPYDLDDQSEDEVVITSAYERQISQNEGSQGSKGASQNKSWKELSGRTRAKAASSSFVNESHAAIGKSNISTGATHGGSNVNDEPSPATVDDEGDDDGPPPTKPLVRSSLPSRKMVDLECGQPFRAKTPFCPWKIVTRYHEWFIGKHNGELIRPYFRKSELLQCQLWDFHYLRYPSKSSKDYALVVPTAQVTDLLDRLNKTLGINLSIPRGVNSKKFSVVFGEQGTPVPRYLGHALDKEAFDCLVASMPPLNHQDAIYAQPRVSPATRSAYIKKFNSLSCSYDRNTMKKNKSDKTRQKNMRHRTGWGRQAKRVQRYLGLRKKLEDGLYSSTPFDSIPQSLDLTKAAPHRPEGDVLFVAMDIESYEFNTSMVTEIGFGILDTRDLVGVSPGERCENWHALIKGRHLRIREHASLVNRVHVHGYENNFNFGNTEFVRFRDVPQLLDDVLKPKNSNGERRNVILVGHGIESDIKLIKHAGYTIEKTGMFLEIVDTQDLYRHNKKMPQQAGLGALLLDLNINAMFLHNGGNDAVYTLQAMLSLALNKRQDSLRKHHEKLQPGYTPDAVAVEEGWGTGGEESDGGFPVYEGGDSDDAASRVSEKGSAHAILPRVAESKPGLEFWSNQRPVSWSTDTSPQKDVSSDNPVAAPETDDLIWL